MNRTLPIVYLARHGETEWSRSGRHTGLTDLVLTDRGARDVVWLRDRLHGQEFAQVLTSPLKRAAQTCDLAGFGDRAVVDPDLVEWHYGDYEGRTTAEIQAQHPGWQVFRDGCPGGETPEQVGARADRVVARVRAVPGDVLLFSSAHFLRAFTARWLGLPTTAGRYFVLSTASLSALGFEHDTTEPAVRLWNETLRPPRTNTP